MLLPPPLALAAETNAAANKPTSVSSLRVIDRGGAGAVLQALADNNASSCVAVQPDPGDASDTLVAWGERRRMRAWRGAPAGGWPVCVAVRAGLAPPAAAFQAQRQRSSSPHQLQPGSGTDCSATPTVPALPTLQPLLTSAMQPP